MVKNKQWNKRFERMLVESIQEEHEQDQLWDEKLQELTDEWNEHK